MSKPILDKQMDNKTLLDDLEANYGPMYVNGFQAGVKSCSDDLRWLSCTCSYDDMQYEVLDTDSVVVVGAVNEGMDDMRIYRSCEMPSQMYVIRAEEFKNIFSMD